MLTLGSPFTALATPRRAMWVLVLLHLPMIAFIVGVCANGLGSYPPDRHPVLDATLGAALGGAQLVLSLRTAAGRSGAGRFVLLVLVFALAVFPLPWVDERWYLALWFTGAGAAMVLTGWLRVVAVAGPIVAAVTANTVRLSHVAPVPVLIFLGAYDVVIFALGAGCLLGATRTVRVVAELSASRAELVDIASRAERERAGRDLHDTLGQRLAAISIKGDLALALMRARPEAAVNEIGQIAEIAEQAASELEAVAHDRQNVSLADELARAVALLHTVGVSTEVYDQLPELASPADRLLGWAVREATTNLLRHSDATICRIDARACAPGTVLEIVNDGARRPPRPLSGLAGLAQRARALDGTVEAGRVGRDRFRVRVHLPQGSA